MLRTIDQIIESGRFGLSFVIDEPERFLAHLSADKSGKETLPEHTNLVMQYFTRLVRENGLDPVVDNILLNLCAVLPEHNSEDQRIKSAEFLKEAFAGVVFFHDLGKINPGFQKEKMGNPIRGNPQNFLGTTHSKSGSYFFLRHYINYATELGLFNLSTPDEREIILLYWLIALSYSISQHHGHLFSLFDELPFTREDLAELHTAVQTLKQPKNSTDGLLSQIFDSVFWNNFVGRISEKYCNAPGLHLLVKISFSLLTASDYYATNEFMNGTKPTEMNIIDKELKNKFINNLFDIPYNKRLLSIVETDTPENHSKTSEISEDSEMSMEALNRLRSGLSEEAIRNLTKNINSRLFYLEAPTGSGKTNVSLLLAATLLKKIPGINKVFYVLPFTTLATQTVKVFRDDLGFTDTEVAELHSKNLSKIEDSTLEGVNEEQNEKIKSTWLTGYFFNYPVLLTSHIKFFNILLSHRKSNIYGIHRLANSVVIIDEIQSYAPETWSVVVDILNIYAHLLNIRFIVMSATLPRISKLLEVTPDPFVELISNRQKYFNNPNFANRVVFDSSLLNGKPYKTEQFKDEMLNICREAMKNGNVRRVLVEIVSKKEASNFFNEVTEQEANKVFDKVFLINGYILEPFRREIIEVLKNDTNQKILVVATQVIEAGVDIDMDLGFKDKAIPDSDEQFAGRINRNAKKGSSKVYLFNSGKAEAVYKSDKRYDLARKKLKPDEYLNILQNKDFSLLYNLVLQHYSDLNKLALRDNLQQFKKSFNKLDFNEVDKDFKLIESDTIQVFVPLDISAKVFTESEKATIKMLIENFDGKTLKGEEVFCKYRSLLGEKFKDPSLKNALIKEINSLVSLFSFNIFRNGYELMALQKFGEFLGDIFYLRDFSEVYDTRKGLTLLPDDGGGEFI
ncbi:MAG: CRISPR-associated helicase Cas3' [Ignavibacteriales bacterium]|nr:MAG: CRISPR-associated helicase Cas3' [Ignavibacteriaceae bacterium]MBW7873774.1 CRISPR-associated helicase Cas3' [Ignavibacteria bacterium]MCZ2143076.1 CRISPR-associated helicase Cas3' [Ignavibacteriales bacterium]OQY70639.1 MAG: hypothetical protein B6D45_10935 [Ignavibacteriales bacterium UTCHB3]MBV6445751.1 hypothetical protein [Ignavibacteriaceae bacterium]